MDLFVETVDERRVLLSELEQLESSDWDASTLCTDWRVRDVVAHLCAGCDWKLVPVIRGVIGHRFDLDAYLHADAKLGGAATKNQILDRFVNLVTSARRPPMAKQIDVLQEIVVHRQDIMLALGRSTSVAESRLLAVLNHAVSTQSKKRHPAHGLRLEATDVNWSAGSGPVARGSATHLLMMSLGRAQILGELSGEGASMLKSRFA